VPGFCPTSVRKSPKRLPGDPVGVFTCDFHRGVNRSIRVRRLCAHVLDSLVRVTRRVDRDRRSPTSRGVRTSRRTPSGGTVADLLLSGGSPPNPEGPAVGGTRRRPIDRRRGFPPAEPTDRKEGSREVPPSPFGNGPPFSSTVPGLRRRRRSRRPSSGTPKRPVDVLRADRRRRSRGRRTRRRPARTRSAAPSPSPPTARVDRNGRRAGSPRDDRRAAPEA
jgi:hypothetical protein